MFVPVPPAGTAHVPSALRKLVVPPPDRGTKPFSVEVKLSRSAVACVPVMAMGTAAEPVLLPMKLLAARLAMRASVICPASTEADNATAAEPLNPTAVAVMPPPVIEKLRLVVRVAAEPVVDWLSVGTSAATIARNVGAPAAPLGAARNVFAV